MTEPDLWEIADVEPLADTPDLRCPWCGARPHHCRGALTNVCTEGEQ